MLHEIESIDHLEEIVKPPIYSQRAILGFSIFFTPLFGGVLLMQNLRDIDKRREANIVLLASIGLTVASSVIANLIDFSYVEVGCNFACACFLTEYFYKKYFPAEVEYEKKKIWKPLIIGVVIFAALILFIFWAQDQFIARSHG